MKVSAVGRSLCCSSGAMDDGMKNETQVPSFLRGKPSDVLLFPRPSPGMKILSATAENTERTRCTWKKGLQPSLLSVICFCDAFVNRGCHGAVSPSESNGNAERCFTRASIPLRCSQRSPMASCRKSLRSAPTGRRRARRNAWAACSSNAESLRFTCRSNRSEYCRFVWLSSSLLASTMWMNSPSSSVDLKAAPSAAGKFRQLHWRTVVQVTEIAPGVARVYAPSVFTIAPARQDAQPRRFLLTQVYVRTAEGWRLSTLMPFPIPWRRVGSGLPRYLVGTSLPEQARKCACSAYERMRGKSPIRFCGAP